MGVVTSAWPERSHLSLMIRSCSCLLLAGLNMALNFMLQREIPQTHLNGVAEESIDCVVFFASFDLLHFF